MVGKICLVIFVIVNVGHVSFAASQRAQRNAENFNTIPGQQMLDSPPSFEDCFKSDSILCLHEKVQQYAEYGLDQMVGSISQTYPGAVQVFARSIQDSVPEEMKMSVAEIASEGRGRGKKILRAMLPILLGMKVKFATIMGLAYIGIVLMAKKALAISVISVAVSLFLLTKKLFSGNHSEVAAGYPSPSRGDATADHLAYSAYQTSSTTAANR